MKIRPLALLFTLILCLALISAVFAADGGEVPEVPDTSVYTAQNLDLDVISAAIQEVPALFAPAEGTLSQSVTLPEAYPDLDALPDLNTPGLYFTNQMQLFLPYFYNPAGISSSASMGCYTFVYRGDIDHFDGDPVFAEGAGTRYDYPLSGYYQNGFMWDVSHTNHFTDITPGTYTVVHCLTLDSGSNTQIITESVIAYEIYCVSKYVPAKNVYLMDTQTGKRVDSVHTTVGTSGITSLMLHFEPANFTGNRNAYYGFWDDTNGPYMDRIRVGSVGGFLALDAMKGGSYSVEIVWGSEYYLPHLPVEVCTDTNGHKYGAPVPLARYLGGPSCTESGLGKATCSKCKGTNVVTMPALGHDLAEVSRVEPTCTEAGSSLSRCTRCDYEKTTRLSALGHRWDEGTVVEEAIGEGEGVKLFTCTACGLTETRPYHICPQDGFTDRVADTSWAHAGIDFVMRRGIMTGTTATTFEPKSSFSRGQIVTVLYRMAGSPETEAETPFTDLTKKYYQAPIAWAYKNGIVNGTTETTFAPESPVSRQDLTAIFFRYYTQYLNLEPVEGADLSTFPDADRVRGYAQEPMSWAVAAGIIQGTGGKLDPSGTATRAQAATIIMRFIQGLQPQD